MKNKKEDYEFIEKIQTHCDKCDNTEMVDTYIFKKEEQFFHRKFCKCGESWMQIKGKINRNFSEREKEDFIKNGKKLKNGLTITLVFCAFFGFLGGITNLNSTFGGLLLAISVVSLLMLGFILFQKGTKHYNESSMFKIFSDYGYILIILFILVASIAVFRGLFEMFPKVFN